MAGGSLNTLDLVSCPGCESRMQPYFALTASGDEGQIDRCTFCGGIFVEHSQLADVTGSFDKPQLKPGRTPRRCARCRTTMDPATVGAMQVEYCRSCTGVYLDEGELEALSKQPLKLRRPEKERPVEVACALCQKRVALKEAVDDPQGRGLLCAGCGYRPKSDELADMPAGLTFEDRAADVMRQERAQNDFDTLGDLFDLF